jgi:ribonuclease VapC
MIVDSSALLALVFREPEAERILDVVAEAEWLGVGAPTLAEIGIVLSSRMGGEARAVVALLVEELGLVTVPFEAVHAREARQAFLSYGRGRHPAGLNYGDCLTYAVAKVGGQPLLFVGNDFSQTDLEPVLRG